MTADGVAAISDAPPVATHSNAWAITPHSRNLTDRQLDVIRDSDGMVGINFASAFRLALSLPSAEEAGSTNWPGLSG